MNSSNSLRNDALMLANQIVKQTGMSFGKAQKQAWATLKLTSLMHQKPVSFFYIKGDGTERFAIGHYGAAEPTPVNGKPTNSIVVRYFDTLANHWRSFRADRLIVC
ncbi:SH3 beta-barrel fold-containing protein [Fibrisoma limi]|nr:SH3 beta-barrel fold-containing protein [Fibrisoma limi]